MRVLVKGVRRSYSWLFVSLVPLLLLATIACGTEEAKAPAPAPKVVEGVYATPTSVTTAAPEAIVREGKAGGSLNLASNYNMPYWDAQIQANVGMYYFTGKLYLTPFFNPSGQKIECDICEDGKWGLEDGGKTIALSLKEGVNFHDGQEITALDVAHSIRKLLGQVDGVVSPRCGLAKEWVDKIDTPSRYEVKIRLFKASQFPTRILAASPCVIYPDGTTREDLQNPPIGRTPYGSGPFILKEWLPQARTVYERNPDYFKQGLPYLDEVVIHFAGDTAAVMSAFITGRSDFYGSLRRPGLTYYPDLDRLKAEGKIDSATHPAGNRPNGIFMNNSKPPFDDVNIRKAAFLAADRTEWCELAWDNACTTALLFSSGEGNWGRPEEEIWNVVPGWGTGAKKQQEIEEAKALLAANGYPDGIELEQLNLMGRGILGRFAEIAQAQLARAGINSTMNVQNITEGYSRFAKLDYLFLASWFSQVTFDPSEAIGNTWITGGARNWIGYYNPEVDRLFPLMDAEVDPAKRRQLVQQIEDIVILQDFAHGVMPDTATEHFWWKRLNNAGLFGISPGYGSGFHRQEDLWLE